MWVSVLDVGICAGDVLVLLAQAFSVELSAFHPQEIAILWAPIIKEAQG